MNSYKIIKRIIDIIGALFGLFLFSPLFIVLILTIYLSDKGPPFFKQIRIGYKGKPFGILKFRSMVLNAESLGGFSTANGDPRITKVGRWIRKTSIDELPQLINVLIGEMSLVGPRPDVPAQKDLYTEREWEIRNSVKPGITGLAQSILRSQATLEQRTSLDLQYVREISFTTDLKIIFLTFRQVIFIGGN